MGAVSASTLGACQDHALLTGDVAFGRREMASSKLLTSSSERCADQFIRLLVLDKIMIPSFRSNDFLCFVLGFELSCLNCVVNGFKYRDTCPANSQVQLKKDVPLHCWNTEHQLYDMKYTALDVDTTVTLLCST